ncbi:16S rRNA (adenine(1518)-N(6)/adenine(1519)-N(6))-dimethyltransferase RsmA [Alkalibacter saccharofermentans]|uniref:Ribosomal RNA small subunit methyltransferase A n=1 Tax=Alkalibacter saccharofermentans DSM 14828 TaxID=1120975 RepID=A0A1M4TC51_9FIRM|nr:16S rRNA (adenine(1518)-N(6)/adenine(1519)-N(6))-dimethyltransferase RsmA [Alkalibacter saccharofermentans]SHE41928.1 16S rRNA (adenine1518-N6/adenine1519-N6)-dimethyltransferase [Alkalibacter saccharofermentans DSM 14828]
MHKLTSPRTIEDILKRHGFKMSKKFGQNFLTDENIVLKIVNAAGVTEDDVVLEIGPGIGAMTAKLCERAKHVLAVEIDKMLIPILDETLAEYENCTVINEDILKLDINAEIIKHTEKKIKVVANLPYYITTPIIMGLLEKDIPIESITVMIQKEVAERIAATPGGKEYGALTVACGYYTKPQLSFIVPASVFIPKPKVDSAVIHMEVRDDRLMDKNDKDRFFAVVKAGFANRRKTLLNTLSNNLHYEKPDVKKALLQAGIEESRRAETLSFEDFKRIAEAFGKL